MTLNDRRPPTSFDECNAFSRYASLLPNVNSTQPALVVTLEHTLPSGKAVLELLLGGNANKDPAFDKLLSPYRGVSYHRVSHRWRARIKVNGKSLHLGYFHSDIEAAIAYNMTAKTQERTKSSLNKHIDMVYNDKVETQVRLVETVESGNGGTEANPVATVPHDGSEVVSNERTSLIRAKDSFCFGGFERVFDAEFITDDLTLHMGDEWEDTFLKVWFHEKPVPEQSVYPEVTNNCIDVGTGLKRKVSFPPRLGPKRTNNVITREGAVGKSC
eukprot:CAMPEP_0203760718 /NCGR_PEP_ID=MMETSP0098-20131031/13956_1 /ASSEMBLY_ACC=CAM_ASM_000208 /TAXON_ID=96639 /ORGANISM=" , Strain NY0313808BC1" /LENGTH=271 /DNA_ID=CAMNT_0050654405 /DNA_START=13 /DNA_END=828 /DNA_ORIENTATION=-